jgi:hypothetical protein
VSDNGKTMTGVSIGATPRAWDRVEVAGFGALLGFVIAVQFSIAIAQICFTLAVLCWVVVVVANRERFEAPWMFWPLLAYAGMTLLSTTFSLEPVSSLRESKQLLLFLAVPVVYRLARGHRTSNIVWVIITAGAVSAIVGVLEYGVLEFDLLGSRLRGTLGHWMTYE